MSDYDYSKLKPEIKAKIEKRKLQKPTYYTILPASVRYDKELDYLSKLIYSEIVALTQKDNFCYAQNNYFAKLYNLSRQRISMAISKLEKLGYLKINRFWENGNCKFRTIRPYINKKRNKLPKGLKIRDIGKINWLKRNNDK